MPATGGILGCEGCYLFHVEEEQIWTQVLLIALAGGAVVGAVALLVRAWRRHGRARLGSALVALGLLVVPVSMVPLTTVVVIRDLPDVTTLTGARVRAGTFADCDKPIYAAWNLERDMPTESGRIAQQACRDAAAGARHASGLLLLVAVGLVVAGAVVGRAARSTTDGPAAGTEPPVATGPPAASPPA
ncbi:MAG: hypothetical protein U0Q07_08810 [Acidimicrobiales bacterium]